MSDDIFDILAAESGEVTPVASEEETLAAEIRKYRKAYYAGTPLITDAEYDVIEDSFRAKYPTHAIFSEVGALPDDVAVSPETPAFQGNWPKVAHQIPMGSLDKIMPDDKAPSSPVTAGVYTWWSNTEIDLRN